MGRKSRERRKTSIDMVSGGLFVSASPCGFMNNDADRAEQHNYNEKSVTSLPALMLTSLKQNKGQSALYQQTRELISARNTYNTSTTIKPKSPTVTLIYHACKYNVHKLHQRYIHKMRSSSGLCCCITCFER